MSAKIMVVLSWCKKEQPDKKDGLEMHPQLSYLTSYYILFLTLFRPQYSYKRKEYSQIHDRRGRYDSRKVKIRKKKFVKKTV